MRAVVIATGQSDDPSPLRDEYPPPLMPLLDRPVLQHLAEALAARGVTEVDWVLCRRAADFEACLGDGRRWGCRFGYHLAADPDRPSAVLRALPASQSEPVLVGHADHLPDADWRVHAGGGTVLFDGPAGWTGWAVVDAGVLAGLPAGLDRDALGKHLGRRAARVRVERALRVRGLEDLLAAQREVLDAGLWGLLTPAREAAGRPGVWLARNAAVHPTAKLTPPVFVGENSSVGAGAEVGPYAAVGPECVIDSGAVIRDTAVFPNGYVGCSVRVNGAAVDRHRLIDPIGGRPQSVDDFLLGPVVSERPFSGPLGVLRRLTAAAGFVAALPLLLLAALCLKLTRFGPVLRGPRVVRTPLSSRDPLWRTFRQWAFEEPVNGVVPATRRGLLFHFPPGLLNVARGELRLVGLPPRTERQLAALPPDRLHLCLKVPAGLVSEASLLESVSEDEMALLEGYYAGSAGWRYDLGLLARYLARAVVRSGKRSAAWGDPDGLARTGWPWRAWHRRPA